MRRATGTCRVFTFKEGVLSSVAHDLRLHGDGCEVSLDPERVQARFALDGLRVDGVMRGGALNEHELDARQRAEIERALQEDILNTKRFPQASFEGRVAVVELGFRVTGELELSGQRAALSFDVTRVDEHYTARFSLTPSLWRIKKYKALLGAIRLQDRVEVELVLREVEPEP